MINIYNKCNKIFKYLKTGQKNSSTPVRNDGPLKF